MTTSTPHPAHRPSAPAEPGDEGAAYPAPELVDGPAPSTTAGVGDPPAPAPATFSLRAEIKKVVDETDLTDPRDIAAKVAENVPAKLLRDALAQALPELVRVELTRARSGQPAPTAAPANRSSKVAAIRDAWRRHLRDRIHVGRGVWQMLADCTAENLRVAADERRQNAAANLAAADRFDRYAAALEEHKVARFADLPESVQAELLGAEEAGAA